MELNMQNMVEELLTMVEASYRDPFEEFLNDLMKASDNSQQESPENVVPIFPDDNTANLVKDKAEKEEDTVDRFLKAIVNMSSNEIAGELSENLIKMMSDPTENLLRSLEELSFREKSDQDNNNSSLNDLLKETHWVDTQKRSWKNATKKLPEDRLKTMMEDTAEFGEVPLSADSLQKLTEDAIGISSEDDSDDSINVLMYDVPSEDLWKEWTKLPAYESSEEIMNESFLSDASTEAELEESKGSEEDVTKTLSDDTLITMEKKNSVSCQVRESSRKLLDKPYSQEIHCSRRIVMNEAIC
ncbi:unnamed protein product [Thelazia callipaeda]|uniref:Peroxin-19 n=1 Tax=Thelazia callipaeda TaxID=103827 RepID=A0A0N5D249_THECL|nr:unnamed protein product [Thelazia callipaeda]